MYFHVSYPHVPSPGSSPLATEVLFGKCRFYYLRHNFSHALEVANVGVASHPNFLPALIEKMRVLLALQDWEQAVETAQRCACVCVRERELALGRCNNLQQLATYSLSPSLSSLSLSLSLARSLSLSLRCLSRDSSCLEAHSILIAEQLSQRGDYRSAASHLGDLTAQLDQSEPHTHWLYHQMALCPARLVS